MNKKTIKIDDNLSLPQIKKITPYLDKIKPNLTPRQRMFCWHYATNGFIGSQACQQAGYKSNKKNKALAFAVQANQNLNRPYIMEAIKLIIDHTVKVDREKVERNVLDILWIQATYDPTKFFNPDGSLAFKDWSELPDGYEHCIEGMEKKYQKDVGYLIVLKLVDKKFALDKLDKYIQMTKETNEVNLGEHTINALQDTLGKIAKSVGKGKK